MKVTSNSMVTNVNHSTNTDINSASFTTSGNQIGSLAQNAVNKDLKDLASDLNLQFSAAEAPARNNTVPVMNGTALTPENIKEIRYQWEQLLVLHKLDTSKFEDHHLSNFTHGQFTNMPSYDHTGPNTVIRSSNLFEKYQIDIKDQLQMPQTDDTSGIGKLFNFLKDADRTYTGLHLDKSGTTVKIVHYGTDEYPALRTPEEKLMEPALSDTFLKFNQQEKAEFFRLGSFLKTLEKIGINAETTDQEVAKKLQNYTNTGSHFEYPNAPSDINTRLKNKETALLADEKILVTHKGISLAFDTQKPMNLKQDLMSEKYSINNFDTVDDSELLTKQHQQEVERFCEKLLNSEGRILMTGYAIAGFGDLVNFQMLYKSITSKHPELKERIDAYAHFYRYSIANSTLDKLLDKDIKVITHHNANRQWDPNYSYRLVSEIAQDHKPKFEIQYNVGSVFQSVSKDENVLRVGEIGGMAGVSMVDDAYFTGLSRGAIGFGIPNADVDANQQEIKDVLSSIIQHTLGQTQTPSNDASFDSIIKERFGLMMARENSQVINQRQFYRYDDVHEGQNLSVGKRVLADILKAMTEQANVDKPIILATGKIEALSEQASEAGLELTPKASFNVSGSDYKQFHLKTQSGKEAVIVQGFFNNTLVNAIMKHADIPSVYSGEGSMNEGLSFGGKGFMIPFYDYQVTTLIESAGIANKLELDTFSMQLEGNDVGFRYDPNKVVQLISDNQPLYDSCEKYDLLKLKVGEQSSQMYLVTGKSDEGMHIKKLDKTEIDFQITRPVKQDSKPEQQTSQANATIYKLEDWAKEWAKLIYDRNSSQLDLNKLGQQTPAMLQEEKQKLANWFDLFNLKTSMN
ncbi:hypothetical protein FM037_11285 [Shewanella psychropiezotolerans]|uniref:Uncharacterized protein n=1 Tax=Shewanella psychropiezotolerans TaxID=2593655 RepID=A0ABX5X167_9GAMM|nr:hypothetical protein [Shewanella psychropiezotolerans]QDO83713.1 hypothetical protein FM037_11285 [Shewanella psychropiezotolerans]